MLLVGIGSSSLFNKNFTLVSKQRKKKIKKNLPGCSRRVSSTRTTVWGVFGLVVTVSFIVSLKCH